MTSSPITIVDLFAGPGGWSTALKSHPLLAGRQWAELGLEWAQDACQTRMAAGHHADCVDVTSISDPKGYSSRNGVTDIGLIASPPCQSYSQAGAGKGLMDPRGQLVMEVLRWAKAIDPVWVACEQVPGVANIWAEYAEELRNMGYSAWSGVVNAVDYGVPQFRKRALLLARRDGLPVHAPTPTHADPSVAASLGLLPWVTLAKALKLNPANATLRTNNGAIKRPVIGGKTRIYTPDGKGEYYMRYTADRPSPTLTRNAKLWRIQDRNFTDASGTWELKQKGILWWWELDGKKMKIADVPEGIPISTDLMGTLQSFPRNYPWKGTDSQQSLQVGNAIPPLLAVAALNIVLS